MSDLASPRSPGSGEFGHDDFDYDDDNDADFEDSRDYEDRESDEDTDLGSEGEQRGKEEYAGIKEQMYQDKLAQLKKQLQQLRDNTHPEYNKKLKKIDAAYKERLRLNDLWRGVEIECVERDYLAEKRLAGKEFEEKKKELKENLLLELEDKKKIIEQERFTLELTGDSMEYKPVSTRKLRRRGNEPAPIVEKRRKPVSNTLQLLLEEREVDEDLKLINKSKLINMKKTSPAIAPPELIGNEPKIENGKLYFDKKWFHKGQAVMIECKDGTRFNAILTVAGNDMIMVRKVPDNIRLKITLAQLAHGKYLVRRRSST
ncbi:sin3 histone deacetylase corepressor complex component SDS3 isoform X2 [Penaeus vannamei]|uniref:sin3 histone deacetylase corepressor complex component SDS3-like isoform X2 n=1 Tax=Penaeus japonicus TaxID=27405 RepID=UPI001C716D7B|nr:sin3 histone deacetylase corepressor complex component SDS3-like isoform X2 [Penaeus japonicus]XP_047495229.1 sin3 histone deacetylase corepressor complex component SDS3-like isoform X2 [Penaeus chinensis]